MGRAARRSPDRVGLIAIVLGGHWLLIEVLFGGRLVEPRWRAVEAPADWIWIPATPEIPVEQPEPKKKTERRPRTQIARPVSQEPAASAAVDPVQQNEPAAGGAPDWISEAHSVAQSMAPQLNNELQEKCAVARRLVQALPEGCKKESAVKEWRPEPKRAGFVGIFPYVRVGRCLLGLGFWGCEVRKPSADGTLLEDFRNPDRPVSAVPDLPIQTSPTAPVPQAFK